MLKKYKQTKVPIIISLLLLILANLLYLEGIPATQSLLQRLNAISYDLRLRATTKGAPSEFPPIYIIDIDEISLEQEGRWPWNRRKMADLIYKITFLLFVVIGAAANMKSVWGFSDAMILALVFPNMIGLILLYPYVKEELGRYLSAIKAKGL